MGWVIIGLIVVAIVVVFVVRAMRSRTDPVDSFRRQIDALGPEARKPTIDQVRRADEDSDETGTDGS